MFRILIADDEPIERMVTRKFIDGNYKDILESVIAENGQDAVSVFREENCQIAILDIEMPGMNGLMAAAQIREEFPNAQIIFLTAFDEFDYAKKAISVRALEYLLKPVDDAELMLAIDEAIRFAGKAMESSGGLYQDKGRENEKVTEQEPVNIEEEGREINNSKIKAIRSQISAYLDENYMHDISLSDVAQYMNYSDAYLCKMFKQCFGISFVMYLADVRIRKAKEMLADVTINIKEISGLVGYQDANYFTKVFKRMEDVTPSEYRLKVLEGKK